MRKIKTFEFRGYKKCSLSVGLYNKEKAIAIAVIDMETTGQGMHKALLISCGEKVFSTIKTELPKVIPLGEYLEEPYDEIESDKATK